jgi:plasmid stabilization system protein ParE
MKVVYQREALQELDAYLDRIRADNPDAADAASYDLEEFASGIAALPHLGIVDPETSVYERAVPDYPLIYAYQIMHAQIEIISVFHTSRSLEMRRW